jgi:hypothetical protein
MPHLLPSLPYRGTQRLSSSVQPSEACFPSLQYVLSQTNIQFVQLANVLLSLPIGLTEQTSHPVQIYWYRSNSENNPGKFT